MSDPALLWTILSLASRMLIVAFVVVAASLAVERVSPVVGAMIATLPLSAGPAYVFLAIDHGPAFIATSAVSSLLSVAATCGFILAYMVAATRFGTILSLGSALSGWAVSLAILAQREWTLAEALCLVTATYLVGIRLTRAARRRRIPIGGRVDVWQIAVRAAAVMLLVAGVTLTGRLLGPIAAGLVALVPIVFSSLIAILQPRVGGAALTVVMANSLVGMAGYGAAFGLLSLYAVTLGSAPALLLALTTCITWNTAVILYQRLRGPTA